MTDTTELRALLAKATKLPWEFGKSPFEVHNRDHGRLYFEIVAGDILIAALYGDDDDPDGQLIAEAVNALPDLLDTIDRLTAERNEARALNDLTEKDLNAAYARGREDALEEAANIVQARYDKAPHNNMGEQFAAAIDDIRELKGKHND